ncbi:MAG: hypothetical protein U1F43_21400 [Myxococcota bacterium]
MAGATGQRGEALVAFLAACSATTACPTPWPRCAPPSPRPPPTWAACVHAGSYGTRSSRIVLVPPSGAPRLWSADGTPCVTPFNPA